MSFKGGYFPPCFDLPNSYRIVVPHIAAGDDVFTVGTETQAP